MRTCHAAIANGKGDFIIDVIKVSEPRSDEVLVKIKAAGLCHTDYDSLWWGKPIVMGHEGAGVVEAVGTSVHNVEVGDSVILNWATPCRNCFQCSLGNEHICEKNSPVVAGANGYTEGHAHLDGTLWNGNPIERSFNIGTLSEYALVKASAVVKNPAEQMPFASASIISCGVMTGYGSVVNSAIVIPDSSVVVLGTGGVGLSVIQGAKISGASKIIAVDINKDRLQLANKFGATHLIHADKADRGLLNAAQQVKKLTENRGADYAFECTAVPELGAAPLAMVRNAGTAVQVSGIEQEIVVDMNLFEWDKIYINPLYGGCNPERDFPKIVGHYESGALKLDEMVTRTYSLENLQEAFDDMVSGKNAKGVIVYD
ncbi:alcohol dehydrogenase catalytic domain-containing protein [Maribacter halichondriae]|uniref:alcohol dehydrogenase catalytic domain-containing protein n=1 Tax=Maribacter halichondriae TaxID=2980554 RepID=UPI00235A144E|nr:alcohol dehydrogenase catalytic domain-containing protein [Maribacter sp. Hal144]